MAKTIKFNLTCDGSSVRTLADLRDHFCVQDVLEYFKNGLLSRWLSVHGYADELEQLKSVDASSEESTMIGLAKVFGISDDENVIRENLSIIEYSRTTKSCYETLAKGAAVETAVLDDYKKRYKELVENIIENKDDYVKIKAAVKTILKDFLWMVDLDFRTLCDRFYTQAPMALFCLASQDKFRKYIIPEDKEATDGKIYLDIDLMYDDVEENLFYISKKYVYEKFCSLMTKAKLKEILGNNLRIFSENTGSYWKDIEPNDKKKYMVLIMSSGAKVRSLGNGGEELNAPDVNNRFVILNGIDYKNNNNYMLHYMEV